jgi:N-acetylglutamate synthase
VGGPDLALVRRLQESAARATPAAVEERRDGAWLRLADSSATWWSGAALLHGRSPHDLPHLVGEVERFYAARGAVARVQVCPACPPDLDALLAGRGYARSGAVSLQVADVATVLARVGAPAARVDLLPEPDETWLSFWADALGAGAAVEPERRLLGRVPGPSAYALARDGHRPVAVGRVVVDGAWAGVFSAATRPSARGRGVGRAVLAALSAAAGDRNATRLYLQVEHGNGPARRLYARAGFEDLATYHYRTAQRG